MILIIVFLLFTFLSYYFACLATDGSKQKLIMIFSFVTFSCILRIVIDTSWNNDYYLYFNFKIFNKPTGFLSYLLNEPYLYSIYAFFNSFIAGKSQVFLAMYWFNFVINTLFFIWLVTRNDVEMWKKMFLFVLHYFFFGFVFLRNGPVYILFAMYFYYTFRNKKFYWIFITPFMHISSCLLLITYFHRWKNFYKIVFGSFVTVFLFFLFFKSFLIHIKAFGSILYKINTYSKGMENIGLAHYFYFVFICSLVILGIALYKKQMLHPILIITVLFYSISFFINPIVAHRFSPYVFFALFLFPFNSLKDKKIIFLINRLTIFLFPIFLYAFFLGHKTKNLWVLFTDFNLLT